MKSALRATFLFILLSQGISSMQAQENAAPTTHAPAASAAQAGTQSNIQSPASAQSGSAPQDPTVQLEASPAPNPGSGTPGATTTKADSGTPTTNVGGTGKQIATIEGTPVRYLPAAGKRLPPGIDLGGNLSFGDQGAMVKDLLNQTVCNASIPQGSPNCNLDSGGTYALIHVLNWGDSNTSADGNSVKNIQSTNWYIYHRHGNNWSGHWGQADFSGNDRFYGAKRVVLLYIHLNTIVDTCKATDPSNPYQARYQFTISQRTPSNIQAVQQLAQLIFPASAPVANGRLATQCQQNATVWGGGVVEIGYKTSDITVSSYVVTEDSKQTPPKTTSMPLSAQLSIINEAKQWWDVSIAVPVKSANSLQYTSSNNTVVPTQIKKQNIFAVADFYLPPTDLAGTTYSFTPHPLVGVSMASQPLHSILVGGAIGLKFAEVFVAADFVKQQQLHGLSSGSPATPGELNAATRLGYKPQFTVGINIPVKAAASVLKKGSK